MLQIVEVESKKQLKEFVNFQYDLYRHNKYFVPSIRTNVFSTFDKEKNPAFEFCDVKMWIAKKNGKTVGRIAGIINRRYNELKDEKYIRFGWLEFTEDKEVVETLIKKVEDWGKEQGLEKIHGPIGMTNFDPCGLLVEGYEETATSSSVYYYFL